MTTSENGAVDHLAGAYDQSPRPASGALTGTGGFLSGFTHTLQPYIGCRFGCQYCYVQGMNVHRFHGGGMPWGEYTYPRTGIHEKLKAELVRLARKGKLGDLAIYMSSATDPYQGLERRWRLTRSCLEVFSEHVPGLLVIQTRSPLVKRDFDLLSRLGGRCWLNFTLETDLDSVRRTVTPRCASISARLAVLRKALDAGLQVQITVSPCLPYSSPDRFGALLKEHCHRVIVDSYVSGDGQGGSRTARTEIPGIYEEKEWGDWRGEKDARRLYTWLRENMGEGAGWSQAGFTYLAKEVTGAI